MKYFIIERIRGENQVLNDKINLESRAQIKKVVTDCNTAPHVTFYWLAGNPELPRYISLLDYLISRDRVGFVDDKENMIHYYLIPPKPDYLKALDLDLKRSADLPEQCTGVYLIKVKK